MFAKFINCKDKEIVKLKDGIINAITMEIYWDRLFRDYICKIKFENIDNGFILWEFIVTFRLDQFKEFYFENLLLFLDANKDRFANISFHLFEEMFYNLDCTQYKTNRLFKLLTTELNELNKEKMRLHYGF